jgi:enoyl-CoA hydratase/carnithine racemase
MSDQVVTYELEGETALIGLNRPEKRNALNDALGTQLAEAVMRASEEAKVGVLYGHGSHFSGGLDLAMMAQRMGQAGSSGPPRPSAQARRRRGAAAEAIARGDIPFIAALQGAVVGWGLEIAACTHVRVADETAFFALPEGQRGIFVGGGGSVRVSRLIGVARMTDMMLTGRVLSAADAERWAIVQYLTPPGEALAKARELAAKIAGNSPLSNAAIVNGLPRLRDMPYDDGLFFEGLVAGTTFGPEAMERVRAFVEKRAEPLKAPGTDDQKG